MSIFKKNEGNGPEEVTEEIQEGKGFKRQWLTIPLGLIALILLTRKKPEAAAAEVQFIDANGVAVPVQPTPTVPAEVAPAEIAITEEITPELPELMFGPRGEAITTQPSFVTPTLPGTKVEEVVAVPPPPTVVEEVALVPEVAPTLEVPTVTLVPVVEEKRVYDLFTGKIFQLAVVPENLQMIDRLRFAGQRGLVSNVTVPGTLGSVSYKVIATTPDELDALDDILSGKIPVPATTVIPTAQPTLPVTTVEEVPEAPAPVTITPEPAPLPAPQPVTTASKVFTLPACSKTTVAQNFDVYTWNWYKPELPANYKWQDATQCDGIHTIIYSTYPDVLWSGGCMYTYKQKFTNVTSLLVKATVTVRWSFSGAYELAFTQIYDETADKVVKEWKSKASLTMNRYNTSVINEKVDGLDPTHIYALRFKCREGWSKQKVELRWKNVSIEATFTPGAPITTIVTATIPPSAPIIETAVTTVTPAITPPRTATTVVEPCSGMTDVQNMWAPFTEMLPITYPSVTRGFKNWQEPTFCDGRLILEFNTYKIQPRAMVMGKVTYTYQGLKWKGVTALRVDGAVVVQYGAPDKLSTHVQIFDETTGKVVKDWGFASDYYTFRFKTHNIAQTISGLDPTHTYAIRLVAIDQIYNQFQVSRFDNLKITATYAS